MSDGERACERLAAGQHGAFSEEQARACGLSRQAIDRRVSSGQYVRLHPRTFALAGTAPTWMQKLWAAQLFAGARSAISHRSAAALWEMEGIATTIVEITTPRQLQAPGLVVHRKRLLDEDASEREGLRLTSPTRTLLDLGDVCRFAVVERALDDALHRGLTSLSELKRLLARAGGRGVRGTTMLRDLVDSRDVTDIRSQTTLERRLGRIIRTSRLPRPVAQFEVFDLGGFIARVDFAYPDQRLAIEADGYRFHGGRQAWGNDLRRRTALARVGWRVLHVTWDDVHDRPSFVVDQIRRSLLLDRRSATM